MVQVMVWIVKTRDDQNSWKINADGSDITPAIRFQSAPQSGFSSIPGSGNVCIASNAARSIEITSGGITLHSDGTSTRPALQFANGSGVYVANANVCLGVNGNSIAIFSESGSLVSGEAPAIRFANAMTSGLVYAGNQTSIVSNGTSIARFSQTQSAFDPIGNVVFSIGGSDSIVSHADGVSIFNYVNMAVSTMTVSNIQITDTMWTPIDDTALVPDSTDGYFIVNGTGFIPLPIARIGGTNALATTFMNSTTLRVRAPSKPVGTYDLQIVRDNGQTASLGGGVTYSPLPTWSTSGTLLGTSIGGMYFSYPVANIISSDSAITTTSTSLPPGTAVIRSGNAIALEGTINGGVGIFDLNDTLYSMTIGIKDQENQDASKTFTLQRVATYSSSLLKKGILNALQTSRDSAIINLTNDTTTTPAGSYPESGSHVGCVLMPDGRVFCVPDAAPSARIYDPVANTLTSAGTFDGAYAGGVLMGDGRVFCVPNGPTTARIYDPAGNNTTTPTGSYNGSYFGGVLLPNGNVFCVPLTATSARIYDPVGNNTTTPTGMYSGSYIGGVLMSDGRVFCVPYGATNARIYDPVSDTLTTANGAFPGFNSFIGGVLLPDGNVFCVPNNSTTARIYDPKSDQLTTPNGEYPGGNSFFGGVLLPDGRVFCVPGPGSVAYIYNPATGKLSFPSGLSGYDGSNAGGVLMNDGRVFCAPLDATTARIFSPGSTVSKPLSTTVILSSFLNKL